MGVIRFVLRFICMTADFRFRVQRVRMQGEGNYKKKAIDVSKSSFCPRRLNSKPSLQVVVSLALLYLPVRNERTSMCIVFCCLEANKSSP